MHVRAACVLVREPRRVLRQSQADKQKCFLMNRQTALKNSTLSVRNSVPNCQDLFAVASARTTPAASNFSQWRRILLGPLPMDPKSASVCARELTPVLGPIVRGMDTLDCTAPYAVQSACPRRFLFKFPTVSVLRFALNVFCAASEYWASVSR